MKGGCISGDRVVSGEWAWLSTWNSESERGSQLIDASSKVSFTDHEAARTV